MLISLCGRYRGTLLTSSLESPTTESQSVRTGNPLLLQEIIFKKKRDGYSFLLPQRDRGLLFYTSLWVFSNVSYLSFIILILIVGLECNDLTDILKVHRGPIFLWSNITRKKYSQTVYRGLKLGLHLDLWSWTKTCLKGGPLHEWPHKKLSSLSFLIICHRDHYFTIPLWVSELDKICVSIQPLYLSSTSRRIQYTSIHVTSLTQLTSIPISRNFLSSLVLPLLYDTSGSFNTYGSFTSDREFGVDRYHYSWSDLVLI